MDPRRRGILEMATAMAIAGTIGWFALRSGRPAHDIVFWRCVFAAFALGGYCWCTGAFRARLSRGQWATLLGGGAALVANWVMLFAAYRHASVAIATAVYNVQPFVLLGLGVALFGERLDARKLGWLGLAFAGVVLMAGQRPQAGYVEGAFWPGIALALGAAVGWALAAAAARRLAGVPPQLIAFAHVCMGALALAPFADFGHPPAGTLAWGLLACIGLVHTALMFALMYAAVQRLPSHLQGALTFINPVVAVSVDVFALGHVLHAPQLAGIAVVLLAAACLTLGAGAPAARRDGGNRGDRRA